MGAWFSFTDSSGKLERVRESFTKLGGKYNDFKSQMHKFHKAIMPTKSNSACKFSEVTEWKISSNLWLSIEVRGLDMEGASYKNLFLTGKN